MLENCYQFNNECKNDDGEIIASRTEALTSSSKLTDSCFKIYPLKGIKSKHQKEFGGAGDVKT